MITIWDEMASTILAKYLPPVKVSKFWSNIMPFFQPEDEFIHDGWERYKVLLNKVSNHGLPPLLEIQFFYNGLQSNTKMIIDDIAGEALISKNLEEAHKLLDEMLSNHYQWLSKKNPTKKNAWVHELDAL